MPLHALQTPFLAGRWYSANPVELTKQLAGYLDQAKPQYPDEPIWGAVVPHAGFAYSGSVAAYVYKALAKQKISTVVILGPAHRFPLEGGSIFPDDVYQTPLGSVPIATDLRERVLKENKLFNTEPGAHQGENSLEMQIPFIQQIYGDKVQILPIALSSYSMKTLERLAETLAKVLPAQETVILASTDLSHFHQYNEAVRLDTLCTDIMVRGDLLEFVSKTNSKQIEACGFPAVYVLLRMAQILGYTHNTLLQYKNSGDTSGDRSRVVGYVAMVIQKGGGMNRAQHAQLLALARTTIVNKVKNNKTEFQPSPSPEFGKPQGAFVTIKRKGQLRGCIGYIQSPNPLYQNIQDCAVNAAIHDPRFEPLTVNELADMELEISVLSPVQPLKSIEDIVVGKTGLIIRRGGRSGLLLPQVPVEWGWDRDTFLIHLCRKAGLPDDGWKTAELSYFTAEVFGEGNVIER